MNAASDDEDERVSGGRLSRSEFALLRRPANLNGAMGSRGEERGAKEGARVHQDGFPGTICM